LRFAPFIAENYRHFGDAELFSGLQAQVTVYDFAVASNQTWDFEAELLNRSAHAIDGVVVLPRIAGVWNQTRNVPLLDKSLAHCFVFR
jgi:hypothetical protein